MRPGKPRCDGLPRIRSGRYREWQVYNETRERLWGLSLVLFFL